MQANYTINAGRIVPSTTASHWLRVTAPNRDELDELDDRYQFPFDYLEAGLDPHEDPRVVGVRDGSDKPALMVLRVPVADTNAQGDQVYETVPMALILVDDQLVTVAAQPLAVIDDFITHTRALGDAEDLALAMLQAVLSAFVRDVDEMDQRTRAMESRLATASRNTLLYEIIALERSLVYFDAALTMIATRVLGNDVTIGVANSQGNFEMNVYKPVIIASFLESCDLLAGGMTQFTHLLVQGLTANEVRMRELVDNSLMLVTALSPHIGYEASAHIAQAAQKNGSSLKAAAIASGQVTEAQYDEWVDPLTLCNL